MSIIIIGVIFAILFFIVPQVIKNISPARRAEILNHLFYKGGGIAAIAVGLLLTLRGFFLLGLPLALWGYVFWTTQGKYSTIPGLGRILRRLKSRVFVSSVRTAYLEMRLHHDSNHIDGKVLQGLFEGRSLSSLSLGNILQLYKLYLSTDQQTAELLLTYLERRYPDWQSHPDAGGFARGRSQQKTSGASSPMTEEEAYAVLGLKPGASEEDIRQSHRNLMKKFHPDQGGSTYLASKINQAKDFLLKKNGKN